MKRYFFAESDQQHGPFTLEELTAKTIRPETLVWYDGLKDWTKASELEELKHLFKATPPPLGQKATQPAPQPARKKSLPLWRVVAGTALLSALVMALVMQSSRSPSSFEDPSSPGIDDELDRIPVDGKVDDDYYPEESEQAKPPTEEELRRALLEKEVERPTNYLTADSESRYRFFADEFEITGSITSSATQATYKDVVLTIVYYTKTDTELSREDYPIYKYVYPNSSTEFQLNVDAPSATKKIVVKVKSAIGGERVR